jgi:hypothetical protein
MRNTRAIGNGLRSRYRMKTVFDVIVGLATVAGFALQLVEYVKSLKK